MNYKYLDKLLNVILKLKYNWITKIDVPYRHTMHDDTEVYNIHIYVNEEIYNLVDESLFPKHLYKIPLDDFERITKTNFNFIRKDVDDLFKTQILSGRIEQDIWFFLPKEMVTNKN